MSNLMELGKQNLIDTRRGSLKDMVRDAAKLLDKYRQREAAKASMEDQTIQEEQEGSDKEQDKN